MRRRADVPARLPTLRRWVVLLGAVGVVVGLGGCGSEGGDVVATNERTVEVELLATVETLDGHPWPTREDGSLLDTAAVEEPATIVVDLGEGGSFRATSQLTFLHQRQGEVVSVEVQPPPQLAPLAETVDDLEDVLERNDALTTELRTRLDQWRTQDETEPQWPSTGERLGALSALGDEVELAVRLRQRGGDGWFYTIALSRPVESWPAADR